MSSLCIGRNTGLWAAPQPPKPTQIVTVFVYFKIVLFTTSDVYWIARLSKHESVISVGVLLCIIDTLRSLSALCLVGHSWLWCCLRNFVPSFQIQSNIFILMFLIQRSLCFPIENNNVQRWWVSKDICEIIPWRSPAHRRSHGRDRRRRGAQEQGTPRQGCNQGRPCQESPCPCQGGSCPCCLGGRGACDWGSCEESQGQA